MTDETDRANAHPPGHGSKWFWLAGVLTVIAVAWGMQPLLKSLLLIFAGALLAVFLLQFSRAIAGTAEINGKLAYGIVVSALLAIALGAAFFMGSRISTQLSMFLQEFNQSAERFRTFLQEQGWWQQFDQLSTQGQQLLAASQVASTARSAASLLITVLGSGVLVLFLGFYFALQPDLYRRGFLALLRPDHRARAEKIIDKAVVRLWRWTLGRLAGMAVIGVGSGLGLWMLGVPLPITLGSLAGMMNFVPNVGPLIAALPAMLFALQQGPNTVLYVGLLYGTLQFVESYFLTPLIDQHQVSLPPGLILSSQLILGVLAGVPGLVLATPLTVVAHVAIREIYVSENG